MATKKRGVRENTSALTVLRQIARVEETRRLEQGKAKGRGSRSRFLHYFETQEVYLKAETLTEMVKSFQAINPSSPDEDNSTNQVILGSFRVIETIFDYLATCINTIIKRLYFWIGIFTRKVNHFVQFYRFTIVKHLVICGIHLVDPLYIFSAQMIALCISTMRFSPKGLRFFYQPFEIVPKHF